MHCLGIGQDSPISDVHEQLAIAKMIEEVTSASEKAISSVAAKSIFFNEENARTQGLLRLACASLAPRLRLACASLAPRLRSGFSPVLPQLHNKAPLRASQSLRGSPRRTCKHT